MAKDSCTFDPNAFRLSRAWAKACPTRLTSTRRCARMAGDGKLKVVCGKEGRPKSPEIKSRPPKRLKQPRCGSEWHRPARRRTTCPRESCSLPPPASLEPCRTYHPQWPQDKEGSAWILELVGRWEVPEPSQTAQAHGGIHPTEGIQRKPNKANMALGNHGASMFSSCNGNPLQKKMQKANRPKSSPWFPNTKLINEHWKQRYCFH